MEEPDKSIKVSASDHKLLKKISAETGEPIRSLVATYQRYYACELLDGMPWAFPENYVLHPKGCKHSAKEADDGQTTS